MFNKLNVILKNLNKTHTHIYHEIFSVTYDITHYLTSSHYKKIMLIIVIINWNFLQFSVCESTTLSVQSIEDQDIS